MFFEQRQRAANVFQQKIAEVAAHAVADQDSLDHQILAVLRHRVSRDLPATPAEPIGKIVKREPVVLALFEHPANRGKPATPVVDDAEWTHLVEFGRDVLGSVVTGVLDSPVAFETESQKIVVLADDLTSWARKVQRESRHIAAEVVDVENQIFRQISVIAPYHPAHTERSQAELVPRG